MKSILLSILGIALCWSVQAQEEGIEKLREDIGFLASDDLEGREMGTEGERMAAEYIAEQMRVIGLKPMGTNDYFQDFSVTPKANPHSSEANAVGEEISGMNVIGYLDNGAQQIVVIGAHFDHLGHGGEGSLHTGEAAVHNGADDNASGVALMLQLAQRLKESNERSELNNYLFIAFSGEEKGLWGSNYFCKNATVDLKDINYMLNFDMVGRLDEEKGIAINGVGTNTFWEKNLAAANEEELKLVLGQSGVGPSDHTSFYLMDIPVLHFFTGQHEDYHKPDDDIDKINFEGILSISDLVLSLIQQTNRERKLEFIKTKEEEKKSARFTVTLGVMPDYLFQGDGMKIDGVTDGKPASKAGIEKGDVVVKMGKIEVTDMYTYMDALSKFKKGDKTKVYVKRGEKVIKKKIVFN